MAASDDHRPVRLRPVAEQDVDDILRWVNDEEVTGQIAAFSGQRFSRQQELEWIARIQSSKSDRVYTVMATDDGRYVGQVGIHQIHWRSRVGRLGCIIGSRQDMGKGFGSAAIGQALDIAFGELQLHKMWLMIFEGNHRSKRIYERLGFVAEGVLREEYFHQDGWRNMLRMGILSREWVHHSEVEPPSAEPPPGD